MAPSRCAMKDSRPDPIPPAPRCAEPRVVQPTGRAFSIFRGCGSIFDDPDQVVGDGEAALRRVSHTCATHLNDVVEAWLIIEVLDAHVQRQPLVSR